MAAYLNQKSKDRELPVKGEVSWNRTKKSWYSKLMWWPAFAILRSAMNRIQLVDSSFRSVYLLQGLISLVIEKEP